MADHVYKKIEIVGSSRTSVEDAIQNAISTAAKSLDHLDWFEVQELRGDIKNGAVGYYQVTLKVGFRLGDD
jgi:flavin-binding protein dodecin